MPETFDLAELELATITTRFARHLHHFTSVDSTMNLAATAGQAGAQNGVWIADEQTAGRGRGGHQWHSAPGDGLYVSILVKPDLTLADARLLPMATGLAVRAGVLEVTGLTLDLRWPNDLMFADRKCGGILVESTADAAHLRHAVIGIGLNLNHAAFPPELTAIATSLLIESGRRHEREPILAAILHQIDTELTAIAAAPDIWATSVLARFTSASTWVCGKRVRIGEGTDAYFATTRGLSPDGFLEVIDDSGLLRLVLSGGVRSA